MKRMMGWMMILMMVSWMAAGCGQKPAEPTADQMEEAASGIADEAGDLLQGAKEAAAGAAARQYLTSDCIQLLLD